MTSHKTSDFDFNLPLELIANSPAIPRDSSKMLVWKDQKILNKNVFDLADFLNEGDVLVLNNTKVIKAKLIGKRGEAKVEMNLHKQVKNQIWQAFAKPAKRLKIGDIFVIDTLNQSNNSENQSLNKNVTKDFFAKVLAKNEDGIVDLEFNVDGDEFFEKLEEYGQTPLPPYIKNSQSKEEDYQTIYAANSGAVAAPTAGLHFTESLFTKLERKRVKKIFTTLNVGAGTFLPVKSELIKDHKMHSEYFSISKESCDVINEAKRNGKRIIAVGTTSLRVLESAVNEKGILEPQNRETNIFIYPPYNFKIVDILMTNFHLPKSTLFMLISAFVGIENAHQIYHHAISNEYRFYSFGDSCLFFRSQ